MKYLAFFRRSNLFLNPNPAIVVSKAKLIRLVIKKSILLRASLPASISESFSSLWMYLYQFDPHVYRPTLEKKRGSHLGDPLTFEAFNLGLKLSSSKHQKLPPDPFQSQTNLQTVRK
ncbi:MAG: hypothetical protein ACK4NX_03815, partial [Candidatus Paceibacteria bacterium]